MKSIHPQLQADLDAGSTTLCRCWRLVRTDGEELGFTDHDEDLVIGELTYRAGSGFTASALEASLGLNVDGVDVQGALIDDVLSETDLAKGFWDGAAVTVTLVDWASPGRRVTLFAGSIGEVSRGRGAFLAELRSQSHALNQPRGRLYQRFCDADLGDARCGVNLDAPTWRGQGTVVSASSPTRFVAEGLADYPDRHFRFGHLVWTSGVNAATAMEVKGDERQGPHTKIALVESLAAIPEPGDEFVIRAGCDKSFETCRQRFGNGLNFRGFPQMPGNDWLVSPPSRNDDNDGGRRA